MVKQPIQNGGGQDVVVEYRAQMQLCQVFCLESVVLLNCFSYGFVPRVDSSCARTRTLLPICNKMITFG
jgi:hypothetical protein